MTSRSTWLNGFFGLALVLTMTSWAAAQTGLGGLRGVVTDAQGGALPGVTITATSPDMLGPQTDITNERGEYRLINLPPGTFRLSAELAGFATSVREGVLIRAGSTFAVDLQMQISTLQETITVSGESPMIEVDKPSNVLNIDGEFQRVMPIQARRNWSDFLELTPGVISRPFDDGSGRQVYFGHATEHFAHVIMIDNTIASNYNDAQVTYVAMGSDMIQDIQVKSGGNDASTPMGTGMAMNVIPKSGGNQFKGSAAYAYQPLDWNGNNVSNCSPSPGCKPGTGTPTTAFVKQFDGGLGGPIKRDKMWFFGSLRRANSESGISRTAVEVQRINQFFPGKPLFNNTSDSWQPFLKLSAKFGQHDVSGFYQRDRLLLTGDREYNYEHVNAQSTGGSLFSGKITSVWGTRMTTTFTASYNNKGGSDVNTFESLGLTGPDTIIHTRANLQGNTLQGSGRILEGGNLEQYVFNPASQIVARGDLTYFKDDWAGSHEFQTGFFLAPRNTYDDRRRYPNDGFSLEERIMIDPNNPAAGTLPFHRRIYNTPELLTRQSRDRDYGIYFQDTWRPVSRLTMNVGLRADFVRRYDQVFKVERQNSTEIAPRVGMSYLVTKDSKNLVRASYGRYHEQVMGRDMVTTFGSNDVSGVTNLYDLDLNGSFETSIVTNGTTATIAGNQFDPDLHQPYVDEFIVGFRKQFPGQLSVDVAGISRSYKQTYARVDINGIYPSGPNQPFGGFGLVDPTRGIIFQQTNNTWSTLEYRALEIAIAKNLSHRVQGLISINRQWQHFGGTWNPTDPAKFIQPNAFPSDALLYMPRGNNEENSLPITTGTTVHTYGPTWQKYSMRFGGTYHAPFGIQAAASFVVLAGPWSGPVVDLLPVGDPQLAAFGPSTTANGQTNPLSTRMRFVYPTRGEGQVQAPAIKTLGINLDKSLKFSGRELKLGVGIFNVLNAGNYTQYNYNGANERFNPNFLQFRNQQAARGAQAVLTFRF
ncbi:MAG: TonB-dependent receptor [Vicinamibacterales bacterium]